MEALDLAQCTTVPTLRGGITTSGGNPTAAAFQVCFS